MAEQLVGLVTDYCGEPHVAIVTEGQLAVGDDLHFVGHSTDFTERVTSMEVDHHKVDGAVAGHEVAILAVERARPPDKVSTVVP